MIKGQRVQVQISDPDVYAFGCADKLNGKTGHIEEVKHHYAGSDIAHYLVCFDTPADTWHANQLPTIAFHFPAKDLREI